MKNKFGKYSLYIVLIIILLISYAAYNYLSKDRTGLGLYKEGYKMDCTPRAKVKAPNNVLIFNDELKDKELMKGNYSLDLYEKTNCVSMTPYTYKYGILKDYMIEHDGKKNNSTYPLSYASVIKALDKEKDKKLIQSLQYYLKDENAQKVSGNQSGLFQEGKDIISLDKRNAKGKYQLVLYVNIVKSDVKEASKTNTYYVFDSLDFKYEKVGVNSEKENS